VLAAEQVHSGRAQHAVNISGGLHHAMRDRASGFCVFNDAAVAIQWLLDQGTSASPTSTSTSTTATACRPSSTTTRGC
jgi:acetoin utilization deacetylase AcuC-like enzyme